MVIGAGLVVVSPASAAPVADVAALRQAIDNVNGTGPATEIELAAGVTYSLPGDVGCADEDLNAAGDLDIRRSQALTIFTADGQAPAVLDVTCDPGTSPQRAIHMQGPVGGGGAGTLTLRNVVIRNGHAPTGGTGVNLGGGVLAVGNVALENVRMENNTAGAGLPGTAASPNGGSGGSGGAVAVAGKLTVEDSTFVGNRAGPGGAGLSHGGEFCTGAAGGHGGLGGQGGAVFGFFGMTVSDSTFSGNTSGAGGNGGNGSCGAAPAGAAAQPGGAGGDGGPAGPGGAVSCVGFLATPQNGVQPFPCLGPMTVTGSTFDGNSTANGGDGADGGKGGAGATGGPGGDGGSFELNAVGGAIMFIGRTTDTGPTTLAVENSTLDGNSTGSGGTGGNGGAGGDGLTGGNGGQAGDGGSGGQAGAIVAAFFDQSTRDEVAVLTHVTITENAGGGLGGAAGQPGPAGAPGTDNVAAAAVPGEPGEAGDARGGSLSIFGQWASVSTVVGTTAATTDGPDCWRPATRSAFSRATDDDVCAFGNGSVLGFDAFGLGALTSNGGPTATRLPAPTSALVDKAVAVTNQVEVDQRGVGRPQATGADIGAVELQLIDMAVTKTASPTTVPVGTEVTFTITVKNTGTSSPQPGVTLDDPNCSGMSAASGDANTNDTLDPGETFTYTCQATPDQVGTFTNTVTAKITDGAGVELTRTASVDVQVTAAATPGATPPLAKTGANNPGPLLLTGFGLLAGGATLVLLGRPRRVKVRTSTT